MNNYCVYKHTCPNGKAYVGITKQKPERRWRNGEGYKGNPHFWNAIKLYGWERIKHEVLFSNISKNKACEIEKQLIKSLNLTDRKYGYNEKTGGETGVEFSDSMKEKMRLAKIGKTIKRGDNWKRNISKSMKSLFADADYRENRAIRMRSLGKQNSVKVQQCDLNLNVINTFDSFNDAQRKTGVWAGNISSCCKGKYLTAGGFKWRFADEYSGRETAQ